MRNLRTESEANGIKPGAQRARLLLPKEREHLGQLILIALTAATADQEDVLAIRHARRAGALPVDRGGHGSALLLALEPVLFELQCAGVFCHCSHNIVGYAVWGLGGDF